MKIFSTEAKCCCFSLEFLRVNTPFCTSFFQLFLSLHCISRLPLCTSDGVRPKRLDRFFEASDQSILQDRLFESDFDREIKKIKRKKHS